MRGKCKTFHMKMIFSHLQIRVIFITKDLDFASLWHMQMETLNGLLWKKNGSSVELFGQFISFTPMVTLNKKWWFLNCLTILQADIIFLI